MYSLYKADLPKNKLIIYLHGGALIFGNRNDIDHKFINLFNDKGFDFLSIDYPLAPYASIKEMILHIENIIRDFLKDKNYTNISLFGRSSGAFLAFRIISRKKILFDNFLCFYGYDSFDYSSLKAENSYYKDNYPIKDFPIKKEDLYLSTYASDLLSDRYLFYIYLRQNALWLNYIKDYDKFKRLEEEKLKDFPKTYMVSSIYDPDVSYDIMKNIYRKIPVSKFKTLYYQAHDFDREYNENNRKIYEEMIEFIS